MRKINPKQWLQLRRRAPKIHPFILDLMYNYSSSKLMTKLYGALPTEQINILAGEETSANFSRKKVNSFGQNIIKRVSRDSNFTSFLITASKKIAKKMAIDLNQLETNKLKKLSDQKIYNLYLRFVDYYRNFALYSIPLWIFGEKSLAIELRDILTKKKITGPQFTDIFVTLVTPTTPSFIVQEETSLFKIAQKAKKKLNIVRDLPRLAQQFGFFSYDYSGPKIKKENNYLKEIKKLAQRPELTSELKTKQNYFKKIRKKQLAFFKKLKFSQREKNIALALQHAAILQDIRKQYNSLFNFKTEILLKEMGRRLGIDFKSVRYVLPQEMAVIWPDKKVDKKLLATRQKLCAFNLHNGKSKVYVGKEMKPFLVLWQKEVKKVSEIKGEVASPGQVKGKVRIIKIKKEVGNLQPGEILVTAMTMPDFLPAIRKCIAIVTDEGGVTCHAAIVSRELGIPCIIGTKIATQVLKNGDRVEVDAERGIVRILKSK